MTLYDEVMSRKNEIMKKSIGIDYDCFESGGISFDYEGMMNNSGYSLSDVARIQAETAVGNTPVIELRNFTRLARKLAGPEKERGYS